MNDDKLDRSCRANAVSDPSERAKVSYGNKVGVICCEFE